MEKIDFDKCIEQLKRVSNYEIKGEKLDLNLTGTYKEIRTKYRKLATSLHPDMHELRGIKRK